MAALSVVWTPAVGSVATEERFSMWLHLRQRFSRCASWGGMILALMR